MMKNDLIVNLLERLIRAGLTTGKEVRGCTHTQVQELEALAGNNFPSVYRSFLLVMGRGAGRFFEGTDIFYPEILTNREGAIELLKEDGQPFALADSDYVFACHQGYQFLYFSLDGSHPDPPVFYYAEGAKSSEKKSDHFSEFLLEAVRDYEQMAAK